MPIVSISLTERNLGTIQDIQEVFGLSGRSEVIRTCLRATEEELRERESLSGDVEGVLIIVHEHHQSRSLDEIRHDYQDLITTQIHSHLKKEKCLEVFIVQGEAESIKTMVNEFRREDELDYVKFVPS